MHPPKDDRQPQDTDGLLGLAVRRAALQAEIVGPRTTNPRELAIEVVALHQAGRELQKSLDLAFALDAPFTPANCRNIARLVIDAYFAAVTHGDVRGGSRG